MTIIWLIWLSFTYLNQLITKSFLIHYVREIYTEVVERKRILIYRQWATLNEEYFLILRYFGIAKTLDALIVVHERSQIIAE